MPVTLDLNTSDQLYATQNQQQFSKLNVYFALNQVSRIPQLEVFGKLYGDKPWQRNMGPTMQGLRIEPTPKTRTSFRPESIQVRARKDVHDQMENQERAALYWHKFRSPLIYWLRTFQDALSDQIRPAMENLNEQIVFANEMFIQTVMWDRSPMLFSSTAAGGTMTACPHSGPPNYLVNPKVDAWVQAQCGALAGSPGLTYAFLDNLYLAAKGNQRITPFNGAASFNGKQNDPLQGKYTLVIGSEAYSQLKWDPNFQKLRSLNTDYAFTQFGGAVFEDLLIKPVMYPWRFDGNGTLVAPEVQEMQTGEALPNPNYDSLVQAPYELGWFLGGEAYHSIKVGPPPKEFAGGATPNQVAGMDWNGKVRITKNVIIQEVDSAGTVTYDPNSDGEYLRLQSTLIMGALPGRPRNALPFIFRRQRVSI